MVSSQNKVSNLRRAPLTIIVNEKGIVTQILTTEGTDFEQRLRDSIIDAQKTDAPVQMEGAHPVRRNNQKRGAH